MAGIKKINWMAKALYFMMHFTGKKTSLEVLNYFNQTLHGDVLFVEMLSTAMKQSYEEGRRSVKGEVNESK